MYSVFFTKLYAVLFELAVTVCMPNCISCTSVLQLLLQKMFVDLTFPYTLYTVFITVKVDINNGGLAVGTLTI